MNAALNLDALYPVTLTKCCTECHRQLPVASFGPRTDHAGGRDSRCRRCKAAYLRQWRTKRAEQAAAREAVDLAEQIADEAASRPVVVFKHRGAIKWLPTSAALPKGADVLGSFDEGADVRVIRENLEGA